MKYLPSVDVKWNLPTFALANISHLRSKYFTAKLFHLPARANFVEKSTHCLGRQMCAFFWLRRWDLNLTTSGLWARRATRLLYSAICFLRPLGWCRWPGSNRYDAFASRDFKSRASASSATPANCVPLRFAMILYHILSSLSTPFFHFYKKCSFFLFFLFQSLPFQNPEEIHSWNLLGISILILCQKHLPYSTVILKICPFP